MKKEGSEGENEKEKEEGIVGARMCVRKKGRIGRKDVARKRRREKGEGGEGMKQRGRKEMRKRWWERG